MTGNNKHALPQAIWFLWLQGLDNAPIVVAKCYESWVRNNPGWKVILLDAENLKDYISLPPLSVSSQALSDIIRINLLAKHGGIWVDATCYCNKPLDNWLFNYMQHGFFAFEGPAKDRMIASWFIATGTDNHITNTYQKAVNNYWQQNPGLRLINDTWWRFMKNILRKYPTKVWFSSFFTKWLKVYPYFWFHYLFEKIYHEDAEVKQAWDSVFKMSSLLPHSVQNAGPFNQLTDELKNQIDGQVSPCYKLKWQYDISGLNPGTILYYLLHEKA